MIAGRCLDLCRAMTKVMKSAVLRRGWERETRMQLQYLGPVYAKVGQLFASLPDVVPPNLSKELRYLCEFSEPQASSGRIEEVTARVDGVCRESFGKSFAEVFDGPIEFIHGASLADVYFGRTYEFGDVAIKIIRPNVRADIVRDQPLLTWCAKFFGARASMLIDQMFRVLHAECDLRLEMENMRTFTRIVQKSQCKCPTAPKPYFASEHILVMERMYCEELTAVTPKIMRCMLLTCLSQLLLDGFLHADPHMGNLKISPTGNLIFLDFGAVVRLQPHQASYLLRWLLALLADDPAEYTLASAQLRLPSDMLPLDIAKTASTFSDMLVAIEKSGSVGGHRDHLFDAEFSTVLRPLVILEGRAMEFDPNFKVLEMCVPIILEISRGVVELHALRKKALLNCMKQATQTAALTDGTVATPMGAIPITATQAMSTVATPYVLQAVSSTAAMALISQSVMRSDNPAVLHAMASLMACYPGYPIPDPCIDAVDDNGPSSSISSDRTSCIADENWLSDPLYVECMAELVAEGLLETLYGGNTFIKSQCASITEQLQHQVIPLAFMPIMVGYQLFVGCMESAQRPDKKGKVAPNTMLAWKLKSKHENGKNGSV
eukprot:GEMP01002424.1.p1 GENE.GEMP01002424.1~~GEMP01002424.1.p1  ORF type:complete len:606 (+),score=160.00 GEMP01002424.1:68-1885(+)